MTEYDRKHKNRKEWSASIYRKAVKVIKALKLIPIVITNQPDVARNITSQNQINQINSQIGSVTGIEHFYTCFHDDSDKCNCRNI